MEVLGRIAASYTDEIKKTEMMFRDEGDEPYDALLFDGSTDEKADNLTEGRVAGALEKYDFDYVVIDDGESRECFSFGSGADYAVDRDGNPQSVPDPVETTTDYILDTF